MPATVGKNYADKITGHKYKVIDITGTSTAVPTTDKIVILKLTSKSGFFASAQEYVTLTERVLLDHFTETVVR